MIALWCTGLSERQLIASFFEAASGRHLNSLACSANSRLKCKKMERSLGTHFTVLHLSVRCGWPLWYRCHLWGPMHCCCLIVALLRFKTTYTRELNEARGKSFIKKIMNEIHGLFFRILTKKNLVDTGNALLI